MDLLNLVVLLVYKYISQFLILVFRREKFVNHFLVFLVGWVSIWHKNGCLLFQSFWVASQTTSLIGQPINVEIWIWHSYDPIFCAELRWYLCNPTFALNWNLSYSIFLQFYTLREFQTKPFLFCTAIDCSYSGIPV